METEEWNVNRVNGYWKFKQRVGAIERRNVIKLKFFCRSEIQIEYVAACGQVIRNELYFLGKWELTNLSFDYSVPIVKTC